MEIFDPRTALAFCSILCLLKMILPFEIESGASIKPSIAKPVIDFPAPDSPTRPRISPGYTLNDKLSRALI